MKEKAGGPRCSSRYLARGGLVYKMVKRNCEQIYVLMTNIKQYFGNISNTPPQKLAFRPNNTK